MLIYIFFHSTSTFPSSYTYIPSTYFSSVSSVSFSYPKNSIICSTGIFFFSKISFSPLINSSSSFFRLSRRSFSSSSCFFSLRNSSAHLPFMVLLIILLVLSLNLLLAFFTVSIFSLVCFDIIFMLFSHGLLHLFLADVLA